MHEVARPLTILCLISVLLFVVCWQVCRRYANGRKAIALVTVALLLGYSWWLRDRALFVQLFPLTDAVVYGNWFLPFSALMAAIIWTGVPGGVSKRLAYAIPLIGLSLFLTIRPLWGEPPACSSRWENGVCLQTHGTTCLPACGATVLKRAGIESTEAELSQLALTRNTGTHWLGMYRALRIKTAGTGWRVTVFEGDIAQLRQRIDTPIILNVGIPDRSDLDPIYREQFGWVPGQLHSVVLLGFVGDDRVEIGDPGVADGKEQWLLEHLETLYRGRGIQLVRDAEE